MSNRDNTIKTVKQQVFEPDFSFKNDFEQWYQNPKLSLPFIIQSGCKINLYLYITGILENGYHSLETLFIPLKNPKDTITFILEHKTYPTKLQFSSTDNGLSDENNTLTKAFAIYQKIRKQTSLEQTPQSTLKLHLEKNVPQGAGLGGSSANAATLILFLELLSRKLGLKPLSNKELVTIAETVGADVTIFLFNQTSLAKGIGEKLKPVDNPLKNTFLLLVYPDIKISTPWAYKAYDKNLKNNTIKFSSSKNIKKNNLFLKKVLTKEESFAISLFSQGIKSFNDFETVVFAEYPNLLKLKQQLYEIGASFAGMSGSGSSIFGVFHSDKNAEKAYQLITKTYKSTFLQCL
ncbi:4-(cytidine 5'-diphospho)-2-C-methyl-D-erythritol kinase [Desulfovibrio litoralis]|uniref:4-diphosphocytidyl-2-C-methyl-D-erythritol kinase n=1 Tax=Desulfovibrio litoralis DSM 11393 TaxID=1121455 RepID=A0A1M7S9G2_9BACT|nr:4-(cytidine 5'-diphospho)-2-C-methyl-D-erythritol kinase [Desulfovibrio litoralis]SHN55116.1 4-diphosphocytidyl-2-C-methyl-D-erythritol kinase [Desulfovibrio litoralis DSM 11393]